MYQVIVTFSTSYGTETLSQVFKSIKDCYKYRDTFDTLLHYSISPIKVLPPIEETDTKIIPMNINVTYRNNVRDVINDIPIMGFAEFFNDLDFSNVKEIRLRFDLFGRYC